MYIKFCIGKKFTSLSTLVDEDKVVHFKNSYDHTNSLFEVQDNDNDDGDSLNGDLLLDGKKWKNEVIFYFYACSLLYLFEVWLFELEFYLKFGWLGELA